MPVSRSARVLCAAGAAAAVVALSACTSSHSTVAAPGASAAPVDGGALTYAVNQEPDCLDPHVSGLDVVSVIDRNLVDSLVAKAPDGKIVPWLAKSWTVSKDLKSYTFTLRDGATFSDGTPVDAAAVKANFDDIANPATKSHYAVSLLGPYAGTTVVDSSTVKVDFTAPDATFLQAASTTDLGLLSPKTLTAGADARCHSVTGSGAFTFGSWSAQKDVVITRRPDYRWAPAFSANQGAAHLSQVTFRFLSDDAVRVGALSSGQAELIANVPPSSAKQITANSGLQLLKAAAPGGAYTLFLKTVGGPLADQNLRLGLQRALDLNTIVVAVSNGQFTRAWSELSPSTSGYDSALQGSWSYSDAKAAAYLDAAGWTGRDSDGYRTKDGKRLILHWLQTPPGSVSQTNSQIATLIQAAAKKVGIQIILDSEPTGTFLQHLYSSGDYDLFASSYGGLGPDELSLAFASSSRPTDGVPNGNITLLDSAQVDQWLKAGAETLDPTASDAAYAKVQKYVVSHAIAIPIYAPTNIDAASNKLHGLAWDVGGAFPLLQAAWLS